MQFSFTAFFNGLLVQIEAEIRALADMSRASLSVDVMGTCGGLFCEALELGAFSGAEHADVRIIVRDAKKDAEYDNLKCWEHRVFNALANHFAPGLLMQDYGDRRVCGAIADALAADIRRMKTATVKIEQAEATGGNLIERLLAGSDDAELTPTELALVEAHLKQPISLSTIQQEKQAAGNSETCEKRNKLTLIRDFNRNLQAATAPSPDPGLPGGKPEADAIKTSASNRRGRKKADYTTEQAEAEIAAEWARARDAGTYKGDFARDRGMKVADLDALLNRVAKRKSRSDK